MSKCIKGSSRTTIKSRHKRLRAALIQKEASPVIIESDPEDRITERLNTERFEWDDDPTTPPSGIIPISDTTSTQIVSSASSSTLSNWASKVANHGDDQATRQLLGQLARVMPLPENSSSSTTVARNMAFENAQKEAIRGLKKARDTEPGSSTVSARTRTNTKAKGKVDRRTSSFYTMKLIAISNLSIGSGNNL